MTQPLFMVDGLAFRAGVTSISRQAEVRDGRNGGTSLSGRAVRDLVGTYYHYTMGLSTLDMDSGEYDALYELLTAPVESHIVTVPYGQGTLTYEAFISSVSDTLELAEPGGQNIWGGLTVAFTAMEPKRTPGGET